MLRWDVWKTLGGKTHRLCYQFYEADLGPLSLQKSMLCRTCGDMVHLLPKCHSDREAICGCGQTKVVRVTPADVTISSMEIGGEITCECGHEFDFQFDTNTDYFVECPKCKVQFKVTTFIKSTRDTGGREEDLKVVEAEEPEAPKQYRYTVTYPELENWIKHMVCPFCRSPLEDMLTCIICPKTSKHSHRCPTLLYDKEGRYIMAGNIYLMPDGTKKTEEQWTNDIMEKVKDELKEAK